MYSFTGRQWHARFSVPGGPGAPLSPFSPFKSAELWSPQEPLFALAPAIKALQIHENFQTAETIAVTNKPPNVRVEFSMHVGCVAPAHISLNVCLIVLFYQPQHVQGNISYKSIFRSLFPDHLAQDPLNKPVLTAFVNFAGASVETLVELCLCTWYHIFYCLQ